MRWARWLRVMKGVMGCWVLMVKMWLEQGNKRWTILIYSQVCMLKFEGLDAGSKFRWAGSLHIDVFAC